MSKEDNKKEVKKETKPKKSKLETLKDELAEAKKGLAAVTPELNEQLQSAKHRRARELQKCQSKASHTARPFAHAKQDAITDAKSVHDQQKKELEKERAYKIKLVNEEFDGKLKEIDKAFSEVCNQANAEFNSKTAPIQGELHLELESVEKWYTEKVKSLKTTAEESLKAFKENVARLEKLVEDQKARSKPKGKKKPEPAEASA